MSAVFKSEEDEEEESMGWLRRNSRRLLSCEATRRFFRIKDLHSSEPMIRSISCFSVTVMFTRLSLNESLAALEKWIDKKNGEMKNEKRNENDDQSLHHLLGLLLLLQVLTLFDLSFITIIIIISSGEL